MSKLDRIRALREEFAKRRDHVQAHEAKAVIVPVVPERIREHAPEPVLRPGGSWADRADAVDRAVREQEDARKARREWGKGPQARHRPSMRQSFNRGATGD